MSAYTTLKMSWRDQDSLEFSLRQMGYDPQVFATAQELVGWSGHTNPKCQIILPQEQLRKVHANARSYVKDVGFARNAQGLFDLHINDMDTGLFNDDWQGTVKRGYNLHQAMKKAQQVGLKVVGRKEVTVKGKRQIQLVCQ